jgi:carboxymethylenebutenolidase
MEMGVEGLPVKFPGNGATLAGYLARPQGSGPYPAIIIHENCGLDETTCRRARRYASEGFVALAVDPLSRQGGTASFASLKTARNGSGTLAEDAIIADLAAARAYLRSHVAVRKDRISVVREC